MFDRRLALAFATLTACNGPSDKSGDTDAAADTDTVTTDGTDTDVADDTDVVADTDAAPAVTPAQLAGVFQGNAPVTACYVTILDHAVVEIAAVDDDTVTLSDGEHVFTCDIVGTTLDCPALLGTTTNIPISAETSCDWPWTVAIDVTALTADGFSAGVAFTTSPSPSPGAGCAAALGACNGASAATFARFVPDGQNPVPPPKASVVRPASK